MKGVAGQAERDSMDALADDLLARTWQSAQPHIGNPVRYGDADVQAFGSFAAALEALICRLQSRKPGAPLLLVMAMAGQIGELIGAQQAGSAQEAMLVEALRKGVNDGIAAERDVMMPRGSA